MDEMAEAVKRQAAHVFESHRVNRTGWTREQWVEDAQRLMDDIDGSVLDLVNGHVLALLTEVKESRTQRAAALALHEPSPRLGGRKVCGYCYCDIDGQAVPWPCDTAKALGVEA
jgi:hypothetical protein